MNPFFVVNPTAGRNSLRHRWSDLQHLLSDKIGPIAYRMTTGPQDGEAITREALKEGFDLIVAVGGDGTLNDCLNGFIQNDRPINPKASLGILPFGTGGDFARYLQISRDPKKAVAHFATPATRKVDVGKVVYRDLSGKSATRYFINISTVGIVASVDKWSNRAPSFLGPKGAYVYGSVRGMLEYRPQPVLFSQSKKQVEKTVLMLLVANGPYFGSGMKPAWGAKPDDKLFDIVVIEKMPFWELPFFFPKLYTGGHLKLKKVHRFQTESIEIKPSVNGTQVPLEVDGNPIGLLPARFEILPHAIRFKI